MNRRIRITIGNAGVALAAALCVLATGNVRAAVEATGAQPPDEMQQLDEIWVHGKSLARRIEDAEDKLFRRYNKLNKRHEYDVVCGTMSLQPGSMIMKRTCQPGFVAAMVAVDRGTYLSGVGFATSSYLPGYGMPCTGSNAMIGQVDMNGNTFWTSSGCTMSYASSYSRIAPLSATVPVQAVTAERREQYLRNFLKVTITDTRLLEMTDDLSKLYAEMDEVQSRYRAQKAEANARRKIEREAIGPAKGPRGL